MLLVLLFASPAHPAEVSVPRAVIQALLPPPADEPAPPPGPALARRVVELREVRHRLRGEASIEVRARWDVVTEEPGWLELALPDPSFWVETVRWRGRDAAVRGMRDGSRRLLVRVDGRGVLELSGEVPGELRRGVRLELPPAAVGEVRVETEDEVEVTGDGITAVVRDGVVWSGAQALTVSTSRRVEPVDRGTILVARSGVGVTVQDAAVKVKARAEWTVLRGRIDEVRLEVPDAGADLELRGPQVARWERQGSALVVQLKQPETERVVVELSWTRVLPDADEATLPLPVVRPVDVFRSEAAVQLARDGDRDLAPALSGWSAVASASLPEVARGLVEGTPVSAWVGGQAGRIELFRFRPVAGPPTIVDVAAWSGAYAVDGRLLLRGHLAVRNDRGAFLSVQPPPGARLVSATVDGQPARIGRDGGTLLIPLAKSVETVQGLLSFPITVVFLTDTPAFDKKDARELALPELGAEVAATRVTLHLPPGWSNRIPLGEQGTVAGFSEGEGLTYGLASGDTRVAEADRLYQDALGAWMSNEFDDAQRALDDLRSLGAGNANVERLQSNLDVVNSKDADGDKAMAARVKQQAQARSVAQEAEQLRLVEEAEAAWAAGDYDTAEDAFGRASSLGSTLEKLETGGAVELRNRNEAIAGKLKKAKDEKEKRKGSYGTGGLGLVGAKKSASPLPEVPTSPAYQERTALAAGVAVGAIEESVIAAPGGERIASEETVRDRKTGAVEVTASALDVVVPASGEAVRYQRLLTRAGEPVVLALDTKRRGR